MSKGRVLSDEGVISATDARLEGLALHWIFAAGQPQILVGF